MKFVFLFLVIFLSSACATASSSKVSEDKIRIDMASLNKSLRGYLYRNIYSNDLSSIDENAYLKHAKTQAAPSEADYIDFLDAQKPLLKVAATKSDFVVCLKSQTFIVCDIASTGFTDFDSHDVTIDLDRKIKEFRLK